MKQTILFTAILLAGIISKAQNIQLHYDLGKDRQYLTSTVEMFKPDSLGSTFFFIDMDYGAGDIKGVSLAYWEIARALKFWRGPFAAHLEYNGGFLQYRVDGTSYAAQIENAYLAGVEYNYNNADFSKGLTLMVLYKNIQGKHDASFQLTGVWYMNFLNNRLSFNGFADFWREDFVFTENGVDTKTKYVFMTEPQIWYNFNNHLSAGSEIELSNNFSGVKGFQVNPTLGIKWTF